MRVAVLALASLVAFSGCSGPSDDPDPATPPTDDVDDSVTNSNSPSAQSPTFAPGDWWTWEVSSPDYGSLEVTTAVARVSDSSYSIGVTEVPDSLPIHILHVPPVGLVSRPDLQWIAHHEPMDLLEFPLTDGKSWLGSIDGESVSFTATAVERGGRTVFDVDGRFTGYEGQGPRFTYDPSLGMFSEIHIHYGSDEPFSSARVIASGTDYEGDMHIHEPNDKFLGGSGSPPNSEPLGSFPATEGKEWLVFACYLGGGMGRFAISYVPPLPNEEPLECSMANTGQSFEFDMQVLWRSSVAGEWNMAFQVAGEGFVEAEVIGVMEEVCYLGTGSSDAPACS
jgi:hypothetical protein